ncbi:protein plastid movement impaired 15-like [Pyrus ussuriensis x Pyrus communis]|uniref:Protein plastid movement impaired 15-like n=1 Tax=Pyrus ussuriensis x Pyrus communis TaxID=2448454 RepID=A0A5N5GGF9_9ROSA|nr:protein plastid movement impaired 15-like [Pyrus ussuriensis x Pyrus communis]
MSRGESENRRRFRKANSLYGEDRILEATPPSPSLNKPQIDISESSAIARELHMARREIGRFKENREDADALRAQAQSEMLDAMKRAKDLSSVIEESNSKTKSHTREIEVLKKPRRPVGRREDKVLATGDVDNKKYTEVMRELELVRRELSMLKLDMASVLEEKSRAEKQTEAANANMLFYTSSVEAIRNEIEEANEEQVLVELARIEAAREFGDIEAEREKEAIQFSFAVDETRKKMKDIVEEADYSKELETKLAVTNSDVDVLRNELKLVKEMDKRIQRIDSLTLSEPSFRKEDLEGSALLQSVTEELEKAKTELAAVKEEGFQYMASMDIIRNELKHLTDKTARLRKTEEKSDLSVQNLNSKLLRAKAKLEAVSASEEKAKSIVSNLSLTLDKLKTEAEAAKKEKELVCEETASIKSEILKMEYEIESTEEKLQAAMQELETVKSSEAVALDNLKSLIEKTIRARAFESQSSSSITISKFEHEYLTGRAVAAEEIADKKVAAAQAWVEALKASEKEILIRIDLTLRDLNEKRVDEEQEVQNWGHKRERIVVSGSRQQATPRKSIRSNGYQTPYRRVRHRKPASPVARNNFPIQKKKHVMPNLTKLFSGKKTAKDERAV